MPSSRFTVPVFAIALAIFLAPSAQAQECSQVCRPWSSCDDYCDVCMIFSPDGCYQYMSSTCGQSGACGGCGVSSTRTVTQRYKYGPQDGGAGHCIGRQYWYGYTNRSQYQRYITEVVTINYQTTTCANGTSTEQEVSRSSQFGECYVFTNGACQSGDIWQTFAINGKECYW